MVTPRSKGAPLRFGLATKGARDPPRHSGAGSAAAPHELTPSCSPQRPWPLGGPGRERKRRAGLGPPRPPCREPWRGTDPPAAPECPLPRAEALRSGSSASGVCRGGEEGGRAAQTRARNAHPGARPQAGRTVRRGGLRRRSARRPGAAGVNSAPGKPIHGARELLAGRSPTGGGLRARGGGGGAGASREGPGAPVRHKPRPPRVAPATAPPIGGRDLCEPRENSSTPRNTIGCGGVGSSTVANRDELWALRGRGGAPTLPQEPIEKRDSEALPEFGVWRKMAAARGVWCLCGILR